MEEHSAKFLGAAAAAVAGDASTKLSHMGGASAAAVAVPASQQLRPGTGNASDAEVCDRSNVVTMDELGAILPPAGGEPVEDSCTDTDDQNSNYLSISNSRSSSCFDLPGECSPMMGPTRLKPVSPEEESLRMTLVNERYIQSGQMGVVLTPGELLGEGSKESGPKPRLDDEEEEDDDDEDEDSSMLTHSAATTATVSSNKSRILVVGGTDQQPGCSNGSSSSSRVPEAGVCCNIVDNPVSETAGGNSTVVDIGSTGNAQDGNVRAAAVAPSGATANGAVGNPHSRVTTTPSNLSNCSGLPTVTVVQLKQSKNLIYFLRLIFNHCKSSGIGEPSVYHALVVIFLEFFAWGLLTMPVINVLNQTFPDHTFLMNGLVMGIKGILSFLSAPLIGALSDVWGRKFFLLITVFFTCAPIPLMSINSWWFFAMISISGVFAVTFSVVFAYVADVTTVEDRSRAYGLVSATFAASLVISPALGAYLNDKYSEPLIVALATAIAVLDVFFILVAVPESLPEKVRPSSWGAPISWEQADPFAALRKVGLDQTILMQCVTVLLSYLPEAGQYSCIFVYLKLKMHFSSIDVSIFIAVVGILSILTQVILGDLMKALGAKRTIIIGLLFEMLQLLWYGFGSQTWMMWAAGILASLASITYPAISAFVSIHSNPDQQGVVQGMVTGMRGLCNGLGPAMFGVIFYVFHVDLNDEHNVASHSLNGAAIGAVAGGGVFDGSDAKFVRNETLLGGSVHHHIEDEYSQLMPGPPFVFGALMVICAIAVAAFIPETPSDTMRRPSGEKKRLSLDVDYEYERGRKVAGPLSPLMHQDSAQL
ncbi:hippocampus abundant transcript 1 protein isoform X1 [Anopheles arabiensis]|uniref:hippocampus abundant transcript 1 protein isoform X1 n=1 Tax=Anopheles arabiensis TaxID=7173 RepID=UPI001AADDEA9|nr:hippocampus abundant transcript 1 protein isoform X1 [Anopheles arabiensis]XP_040156977.1 hippocampus abundant transcript 1 protein isoform X1 [Anopheles arabiensis]